MIYYTILYKVTDPQLPSRACFRMDASRGELDSQNTFTILCAREKTREAYAGAVKEDTSVDASCREYESMISRFVNALHGSIDMPAQYMATVTLGLPLEYTSHTCEKLLTHQCLQAANKVLKAADGRPARRDAPLASEGATSNVAGTNEDSDAHDFAAVTTDGKGSSVVVGPLDDYRYRVAGASESDKAVQMENLSMVQFALGVYKTKRSAKDSIFCTGDPFRFALHSDHSQAAGHVLVFRQDQRKRVFVFLGPTARPETPEAFAQFILLFFKPWHGANGIESLLQRSDVDQQICHTWSSALAEWTLESRQGTDPLWYARSDGALSHPYIDNIVNMFEGEDRAREMALAMKRLTREERLELVEFRGGASDDKNDKFLEGDADYARAAGHRGIKHYRPAPKIGRPLRSSVEKIIVAQRVGALQDDLLTQDRIKAVCNKTVPTSRGPKPGCTLAVDSAFGLDNTGKVTFCNNDNELTSIDAAKEWQTALKVLANNCQEEEVKKANAVLVATAKLGQGCAQKITESVVDLTPSVSSTGCMASVSASEGRYVPRGCSITGASEPGLDHQFQGPSLAEMAIKFSLNPRQALGLYIAGKAHVAQLFHAGETTPAKGEIILFRGEPGVGKSRIASAFLEWAHLNGIGHTVVGGCATGKAGANIGLPTIHRSANILFGAKKTQGKGAETTEGDRKGAPKSSPRDLQLKRLLEPACTYVNDECSLTRATLLWDLSEHLNRLRHVGPDAAQCFGNLNFLMIGDYYQKIGMNLPMYGAQLCMGMEGTENMSKSTLDTLNKGRGLYSQVVKTISLVEQVRASSDLNFQRLNRHVRYGTGTSAMALELNTRCLQVVSEEEKDDLLDSLLAEHDPDNPNSRGCILALRHAVLDRYDQLMMPLFARRYHRRLVKMPSTDVVVMTLHKQLNRPPRQCKVSKLPVAAWLKELMDEFPTVLTASKCGKVPAVFDFVLGASYRLTISQKHANMFGGCNGCLGTAVGFVPNKDEPGMPEDLENDEPWVLKYQPTCLLIRLHDTRLLLGKRVGDLPEGVVPWYPDTVHFTVEPAKLDKVWTATQRNLGQKIADGYVTRRVGFSPKPAVTNTDVRLVSMRFPFLHMYTGLMRVVEPRRVDSCYIRNMLVILYV